MATVFSETTVTFSSGTTVEILGSLSAAGIPDFKATSITINTDAAANTHQDPALGLLGGSGSTNLERTTLIQDSSAVKVSLKRQSGSAGATEASPTLHLGVIGTTAAVNSTLVLEAGASSTNKPASLTNTGATGVLAIAATTGVTVTDSVATLTLNAGAVSTSGVTTLALTASSTAQVSGTAVSLNGSTAVSAIIPDNTANAFRVLEGANEYVKVVTTNSSEKISLGNATTNPAFEFLGTGTTTHGGNVAMGGNKITGLAAASANGEAVRYEQAVLNTSVPASIVWEGSSAKGGTNTLVMRWAAANAGRTQGTGLTMVQSAANGDYIQVTSAGVYAIATSVSTSSAGYIAIKANSAVDNNGIDSTALASEFIAGSNQPCNCAFTGYLAANTRIWVACQQTPDGGSTGINMISVAGPLH